jgi:hypothetical protein
MAIVKDVLRVVARPANTDGIAGENTAVKRKCKAGGKAGPVNVRDKKPGKCRV